MDKKDHFVHHLPHLAPPARLEIEWLIRFDELFARHKRGQERRQALRRAFGVSVWLFFAIFTLLLLVK